MADSSTEKLGAVRIPFGLKDGRAVTVSEVSSGLSCGCRCPACNGRLQAKKGKIRTHHFSHHSEDGTARECKNALETSIHLMAKQIIEEHRFVSTPDLTVSRDGKDEDGETHVVSDTILVESRKEFQRIELERWLNGIRPDIVGYTNDAPLIIEVAVTNRAGEEKKERIRSLGIDAIEIDLSGVGYDITREELARLLLADETPVAWLANSSAIGAIETVESKLQIQIEEANVRIRAKKRQVENRKSEIQIRGWEEKRRRTPTQGTLDLDKQDFRKPHGTQGLWFRCEACLHVFFLPTSGMPSDQMEVSCPDCRSTVSTTSCFPNR